MRKLIAGMKMTLDGKIEGAERYADWVEAWSDEYDVMPRVDACILGGGMYPGYERYWTAVQRAPTEVVEMTGTKPTADEVRYARFAEKTPHYVLSTTLTSAAWPTTRFLRSTEDIAALKKEPGKDIYLVGGARIVTGLVEAGLVDELRTIVYPLVAGAGKALFEKTERRHPLELRKVEQLSGGRVSMTYILA